MTMMNYEDEVLVPSTNLSLLSFSSGRALAGTVGDCFQNLHGEVDLKGTEVNCGPCGSMLLRPSAAGNTTD